MKLSIPAFALAFGILWGAGIFLATWWVMLFDGPTGEITLLGRLYRGYSISPIGSVIGFVWGLFDGVIAGTLFAWLYNQFARIWPNQNRLQKSSRRSEMNRPGNNVAGRVDS